MTIFRSFAINGIASALRRKPFLVASFIAVAMLGTAGCRFPQDPNRTLDKIEGSQLIVGVPGGANGTLTPRERTVIERLTRVTKASLRLVRGDQHRLFARLAKGKIHLVAGAIPDDTPWKSRIAVSDPVETIEVAGKRKQAVFALQQGENAWLIAVNRAIANARHNSSNE